MATFATQPNRDAQKAAMGSADVFCGACTPAISEYGNWYCYWYYPIPASRCHAPDKLP